MQTNSYSWLDFSCHGKVNSHLDPLITNEIGSPWADHPSSDASNKWKGPKKWSYRRFFNAVSNDQFEQIQPGFCNMGLLFLGKLLNQAQISKKPLARPPSLWLEYERWGLVPICYLAVWTKLRDIWHEEEGFSFGNRGEISSCGLGSLLSIESH